MESRCVDHVDPRAAACHRLRQPTTALRQCRCARTSHLWPASSPPSATIDSTSIGDSFQRRIGSFPPGHEPSLLLFVTHREPVLAQQDAVLHQQSLEHRALGKETSVLLRRAETHHPLDAGAVVPGPVHQHDLAGRRQLRDVALEVPLAALALGRRRERDDAGNARVQILGDPLDGAALAGRVPSFEDHEDAGSVRRATHSCMLDQFGLQSREFLRVYRPPQPGRIRLRLLGHHTSSHRVCRVDTGGGGELHGGA